MGVVRGLFAFVAALCLLVAIAGCGGNGSSDASAKDSGESGIPDSAPEVDVPAALPPTKLVVKDLSKGTGAEAKKGDEVSLQYYCVVWKDGDQYANSWSYQRPPTFVLGSHRLLRGLNMAVPGMTEGGGREVRIPNTLLYYREMNNPPLGRLAALICKVYLVEVVDKAGRG
jgi:peptidylprolyl isomerase